MNTDKKAISASVEHGEKVHLTDFWQDKNVICPNTKLFYVIDGEIVIETKKESFTAVEGDMVLIPAGTMHNFHLSKLNFAKKYWLHVDIFSGTDNFFQHYSLPYKIHVGKNNYIESLFQSILKLYKSKTLCDRLSVSSMICSILSFYAEQGDYQDNNAVYDEIDATIAHIKANYSLHFTLNELAKVASLSPSYFVRKFKERTGYSPLHYVNVLKIDKAKTMIEQSTEPINSIMEKLGFLDSAHFSKLFKSYTGYSPVQFRKINGYRKANKKI